MFGIRDLSVRRISTQPLPLPLVYWGGILNCSGGVVGGVGFDLIYACTAPAACGSGHARRQLTELIKPNFFSFMILISLHTSPDFPTNNNTPCII